MKFLGMLTFVLLAIWKGIPPNRWGQIWNEIESSHEAEVRAAIWELKKQGRIREDKHGRLWSTKGE